MNKSAKHMLAGVTVLVALGGFLPSAVADFCYGSDLQTWAAESHCAGNPQTNYGYAFGGGTKGTSTAFMRANLTHSAAGGATDIATGYGWRSDGQIAGTPQCYGGPGGSATLNAPGCVTCYATDLDTGSGTVVSGPAGGACTSAVTHQVVLTW